MFQESFHVLHRKRVLRCQKYFWEMPSIMLRVGHNWSDWPTTSKLLFKCSRLMQYVFLSANKHCGAPWGEYNFPKRYMSSRTCVIFFPPDLSINNKPGWGHLKKSGKKEKALKNNKCWEFWNWETLFLVDTLLDC